MVSQNQGAEPPSKRRKVEKLDIQKFRTAAEISQSIRDSDEQGLTKVLTALRNQLTLRYDETAPGPQDERVLLAKSWMEASPGGRELFDLWGTVTQRQMGLCALIVSVLSCLVTLLSSHYNYHPLGLAIIKTLLTNQWSQRLNQYIGGANSELILVSLKLFNGMSAFAGGRERKAVMDCFAWETKVSKLLNMRRRTKSDDYPDTLARPDIRTLYILFILSFLDPLTPSVVKSAFIETRRDSVLSIFKGLTQDSYSVIRKVLETCWAGLWSDAKIKRTLKVGLFNEATISHIHKLYDRGSPEGDLDQIPADLAHHFLLAICTHPGTGICFKDKGWYPRETELDTHADEQKSGKIYNKILSNLLKILKANDDLRQQELAIKIMVACPELVAGYWHPAGLTLEPRLSSKWLANVAFFGSVISLPVPTASFMLSDALYQPSPPPTSSIIENILPSVHLKTHLSKGLQSPSPLVQHCCALALSKCLEKYHQTLQAFESVASGLEEGHEGQWRQRIKDVEREVRRRVPEFQVVVAYSQQKLNDVSLLQSGSIPPDSPQHNPQRTALLSESALRLLWLYHAHLPSLVAEARFDVGKLLASFLDAPQKAVGEEVQGQDVAGLHILRQLHVLRLLKESDQFVWSGKIGSSSSSNFHTLLRGYISSEVVAIKAAIASLLKHSLSESILLQHDTDEIHLWLDCLSPVPRAPGAEAPDGASLTDEGAAIVNFLDDCALRCSKTPYKYLEELCTLGRPEDVDMDGASNPVAERSETYPSPLIVTVIEQAAAKVTGKLLSPSDALTVVSFIRKLLFKLAGKVQDLVFFRKLSSEVDRVFKDGLFPEYPSVSKAIRREVSILSSCIAGLTKPEFDEPCDPTPEMETFLRQVENVSEDSSGQTSAYELVEWLRLVDHPIHISEANRLISAVEHFHPPALRAFAQFIHPRSGLLWNNEAFGTRLGAEEQKSVLNFDWLLLQTSDADLETKDRRDLLVNLLSARGPNALELKRATCLIGHRVSTCHGRSPALTGLLNLLCSIVELAKARLSTDEFGDLKKYLFLHLDAFKALLQTVQSDSSRDALQKLLSICLTSQDVDDIELVNAFVAYWSVSFRALGEVVDSEYLESLALWIPFMSHKDVFPVLDNILDRVQEMPEESVLSLLESTLARLTGANAEEGVMLELRKRLSKLLSISSPSPAVQSAIAEVVTFSMPLFHDASRVGSQTRLGPLIEEAELRWAHRLDQLPEEVDILRFLSSSPWSRSSVKIIWALIYRSSSARTTFSAWLKSGGSEEQEAHYVVKLLHAYWDSAASDAGISMDPAWLAVFNRLVDFFLDSKNDGSSRTACGQCLSLMVHSFAENEALLAILNSKIQALPVGVMSSELLLLGGKLCSEATPGVAISIVDCGLQWAVRCLSNDSLDKTGDHLMLNYLSKLIVISGVSKPHLAEPVIISGIKNHLDSPVVMRFCDTVSKYTKSKPAIVNRHLQSVVQHPRFYTCCATNGSSTSREAVVQLLHTLFDLHPSNTCQPSHVEPLRQIYGGTLSLADRRILSIFQLFEAQRKASCASILCRWSSTGLSASDNSLGALQSLDSNQVFRTCLQFPTWRKLSESEVAERNTPDSQIYDPVFLMLLFAHMTVENPPTSALGWVELFRTNVFCVIVRALSSKDDQLRELSLVQTTSIWKQLVEVDMQEKPHVMHILHLLKDTFPANSHEPPIRLPTYTTLVLCHSLRGVFYPSNFIYPLTARFLLQRPELDTKDVPMLLSMLYSTSDEDWRKERAWIVRFLADGISSTDDWRALKRRHTWDLLASMFQSFDKDLTLRSGILEVLANLTCNQNATNSLLLKSGLLSWVEMQLQNVVRDEESLAWALILENIITVIDPAKINSSTKGGWSKSVARCLSVLLDVPASFSTAVSVLLRLTSMGCENLDLEPLISKGLTQLKKLEGSLVASDPLESTTLGPQPPHRARAIREHSHRDPVLVWGEGVERLWRVAMTSNQKGAYWDNLSSRMLLWRSIANEDHSEASEWARREVVTSMQTL